MATPAAKALVANAYIASPVDVFDSANPETKKVSAAYAGAYGKKSEKAVVQLGYAQSKVMYQVLKQACQDKDLSRAGIIKASHELSGDDLGGLVAGPLDYTKVGQPPTRKVFLTRPANVPGELKALGTFETSTAKTWTVGAT